MLIKYLTFLDPTKLESTFSLIFSFRKSSFSDATAGGQMNSYIIGQDDIIKRASQGITYEILE